MSGQGSLEAFVGKWQSRWPEWHIAAAFLPAAVRARASAWFALLQELTDAAWGGADPTPGLAKLAWWQEELRGWAKGARRHPLGETLQKVEAPWTALALALTALPPTRGEDGEGGDALSTLAPLAPLARAVAGCEAALFGGSATAAGESSVLAAFEAIRSLATGDRAVAQAALQGLPAAAGTVPRRLHDALLAQRLRRFASGGVPGPVPGWRVLLLSWRAARGR